LNRFPPGHLFLVSLILILGIDLGVSTLAGGASLFRLGMTRLLQIACLAGIIFFYPRGAASLGLAGHPLPRGIKTGILWSAFMGLGAAFTAGLVYLAGNNPFTLLGPGFRPPSPFFFFLTACVLSPIAEELFFRGFLYAYLRRFIQVFPAVVLSASVFAACHASFSGLPVIPFAGGLVFAAAFEYSKSLAAPFIIHILGNTALGMVQYSGGGAIFL